VSKIILSALALVFVGNANAAPVRFPQPKKPEIQEVASNVFFEVEKPYVCILEGKAQDAGFFTSGNVSVRVTATNLRNAAEVSMTSQILVEEPQRGRPVKVRIEGITYSVSNVNCKPVEQSI
jgi:hypothetical protein